MEVEEEEEVEVGYLVEELGVTGGGQESNVLEGDGGEVASCCMALDEIASKMGECPKSPRIATTMYLCVV